MPELLFKGTLFVFSFLFPLFFLTATADAYEYNKMALLVVITLVLFFLFCQRIVKNRRLILSENTFGRTLFLLSLAVLASSLLQSPNLVIALTTPLSVTTLISGSLLYFMMVNSMSHADDRDQLFLVIVFSSILVSFYTILLFANVLPKDNFTPAGNLFATALFLSVIAVHLITKLITITLSLKNNQRASNFIRQSPDQISNFPDPSTVSFYALSLLIVVATLVLLVFHLTTDQKPVILGTNFGWIIFAETAKNLKTLFLGVGPTNFITAFTLGKPVFFNNSPYWNIIFTSSSSFLLNLATEAGVVSAVLFLIIFFKSIKLLIISISSFQTKHHPVMPNTNHQQFNNLPAGKAGLTIQQLMILPYQLSLVFALFLLIIFPGSMVLFILTVILLSFSSPSKHGLTIDLTSLHHPPYFLLLLPVLLSLPVLYFGGRWYLAETYFKKSLDAALNNQGTLAYNLQLQAINLNPSSDRYLSAFSRLNLTLANALVQKDAPSDEDKQNIPRLVQQAIDYGRNAVVQNKTSIANWDNLAQTYASLLNFAQGSDTWAVTTYQQKIQLDPVNPQNHINFGRFYLALKKYPEAENQFRQAIALKPDLAASYYNLALALREQKKYQEAYTALQNTLVFVAEGSKDAETVESSIRELLELDGQLAASSSAQTGGE